MAHSAFSTPLAGQPTGPEQPSIGTLAKSAMADVSTLIRSEIELAKAEVGASAKRAGLGAAFFGVAGAMLAVSGLFLLIAIAELLTELGLPRWVSYLIVWAGLVAIAALFGLLGMRKIKKIRKPEKTLETLRDLPDVMHRELPGQRRRDLPTVSNGRVERRDPDARLG